MRSGWLFPAVVATLCSAQTNPGVVREGAYWVETVTGTAPVGSSRVLRVATRGAVSLRGEARGNITYVLKKRAAVKSEAAAHALLDRISVKTAERSGELLLEVDLPAGWASSASLQVRVPRELRETILESQGDTIEAYDLKGMLRADSNGGRVHVDRVQGRVVIRTEGGQVRLGEIGGGVQCFSGGGQIVAGTIAGEAALNSEGGEIVVKVAKGPVRASTGGGNIRIEQANHRVVATARAGLIEVVRSSGPVVAQTAAGAIKVRSAGDIECQAGAGAIALEKVFGGLRASTRSGSIVADLAGKPLKDSTLTTGAGDITVFIPSNLSVTVRAISVSPGGRRIVSDFSEIRTQVLPAGARVEAQGALNGGGPLLRLTALEGAIYLRRVEMR
jgi:hypothetical protein